MVDSGFIEITKQSQSDNEPRRDSLSSIPWPFCCSPPENEPFGRTSSSRFYPRGALFYNIGIVATGVVLLLFFLGLAQWKIGNNRIQNLMLRLTQGFGILGSLALLMSGLFPINFSTLHSFFSICLYILLGTAFGFSVAAIRYHPTCPRWLLILGAIAALVDILSGVFHTVYVLEWVTVSLFLCYPVLLGAETNRLLSETMDRPPTKQGSAPSLDIGENSASLSGKR